MQSGLLVDTNELDQIFSLSAAQAWQAILMYCGNVFLRN